MNKERDRSASANHARAKLLCMPSATCACQPPLSGCRVQGPSLNSRSAAAGQPGRRGTQPRITLMVAWWPARQHQMPPSGPHPSPTAAGGLGSLSDPSQRPEQPASPRHSGGPGDGGAGGRPAFFFEASAAPCPLKPAMRMPRPGCTSAAGGRGRRRKALVRGGGGAARAAAWLAGFQGAGGGGSAGGQGGAAWEHPETIQQAWVSLAGRHEVQPCVYAVRMQGPEGHAESGQAGGEAGERCRSRHCGACVPLPGLKFFLRSASEVAEAYGLREGT